MREQAFNAIRSAYECLDGAVGNAGDYMVISCVAGLGYSLEQTASKILGRHPSKLDRTRIGDRLRNGLDELAAKWVPEGKKQTIRTWRPREAIPRESMEAARGTTLVTPSPVAHATSRGRCGRSRGSSSCKSTIHPDPLGLGRIPPRPRPTPPHSWRQ